jgi:HAD superfamily hydrolase (TIGR01509 family)
LVIRAIFFDLDGVLVDFADLHYEALNRAVEECGFPGIGRPEHLAVFNGLPTKAKLRLLEREGRIEAIRSTEIEALKQKYTVELAGAHVRPDPVKVEMCRELAKEYILVVVSNCVGASVTMLMSLAGLSQFFYGAISNQDVEHAKPAPDPYLLAMGRLASHLITDKREVLVIEDNEKGVRSAQAAGLEVVQLQYPYITLEVMRAVIKAAERKMGG